MQIKFWLGLKGGGKEWDINFSLLVCYLGLLFGDIYKIIIGDLKHPSVEKYSYIK